MTAGGACDEADVRTVATLNTRADANPEIVKAVPGKPGVAVLISSKSNELAEVLYDASGLEFGREAVLDTGSDTSNMASVAVHPDGKMVGVMVTEGDCVKGRVLFVDIDQDFGKILSSVEVGYGPDSGAFSKDGTTFVTVDEDDREDHPCKPADRNGGTVTVLDISGGPTAANVLQTIAVDHATDSEPEGVYITSDGMVFFTVQETSELGFFSLSDVPNATATIVSLPDGSEPDSLTATPDEKFIVVGLEAGDGVAVFSAANKSVTSVHTIRNSGEVPADYARDDGRTDKWHEPEDVVSFAFGDTTYVAVALQESHAVIVYRLSDAGELTFDSIAPVGDWETNGSEVGSEGLTFDSATGTLLTANEREGSVTLVATAAADGCD